MDYFALICSIFYILAGIIASAQLLMPHKRLNSYFIPCIILALATHAYWLYQHILLLNGQNLPILNVLALVTFIIALLSTLASGSLSARVLLPLVYGFTVVNFIAVVYLPSHYLTHIEDQPQLALHIILALLAYSILSIASLFALQLAYLDYRLKNRKFPCTKINFPPLLSLEKSLFQIILTGFILLTCALLTGLIFVDSMFASEQADKTILSLIAWVIYAILLWGHFCKGWRGRFIVYITIASSSLLTLAYFGSRFVREIILN